jgi:hypothetical protein
MGIGCGNIRQYNWRMWANAIEASKENTGPSSPSISVGAILNDLAPVYPAVTRFYIGPSLMQAILSPQETADFLFFLMSEMSTVNAGTTTRSMAIISYFIDAGWRPVMEEAHLIRLRRDIEMSTSRAKPRKSGARKSTKSKSRKSKKS